MSFLDEWEAEYQRKEEEKKRLNDEYKRKQDYFLSCGSLTIQQKLQLEMFYKDFTNEEKNLFLRLLNEITLNIRTYYLTWRERNESHRKAYPAECSSTYYTQVIYPDNTVHLFSMKAKKNGDWVSYPYGCSDYEILPRSNEEIQNDIRYPEAAEQAYFVYSYGYDYSDDYYCAHFIVFKDGNVYGNLPMTFHHNRHNNNLLEMIPLYFINMRNTINFSWDKHIVNYSENNQQSIAECRVPNIMDL